MTTEHIIISKEKGMLRFPSEVEYHKYRKTMERQKALYEAQMKLNAKRRAEGIKLARLARNEDDLRAQYMADEITLDEFEDGLDIIYGLTRQRLDKQ